jgi:hypothetical protein
MKRDRAMKGDNRIYIKFLKGKGRVKSMLSRVLTGGTSARL